jgi:hypothetical protein
MGSARDVAPACSSSIAGRRPPARARGKGDRSIVAVRGRAMTMRTKASRGRLTLRPGNRRVGRRRCAPTTASSGDRGERSAVPYARSAMGRALAFDALSQPTDRGAAASPRLQRAVRGDARRRLRTRAAMDARDRDPIRPRGGRDGDPTAARARERCVRGTSGGGDGACLTHGFPTMGANNTERTRTAPGDARRRRRTSAASGMQGRHDARSRGPGIGRVEDSRLVPIPIGLQRSPAGPRDKDCLSTSRASGR